jgi:hypothetical protein
LETCEVLGFTPNLCDLEKGLEILGWLLNLNFLIFNIEETGKMAAGSLWVLAVYNKNNIHSGMKCKAKRRH